MKLVQTLASRRLLKDHTNFHPNFTSRKLYCGFDPTADSLHLGHLSTLNALVYGAIVGIQPIALIGTATGMIGDPSGRSTSRPFLSSEQITHNAHKLSAQIQDTFHKLYSRAATHLSLSSSPRLEIVYNDSFYQNQSIISFLREVGSLMPISPMLSKEMVKSRIDSLTYTEFSYQLLQAYDFYYLYYSHECGIQIGGSDQWGNITTGTELIRKKTAGEAEALGITLPLVTTANGEKFGKSLGNAMWIDAKKTSSYSLYQYFYNLPDASMKDLLLWLSFAPESLIDEALAQPLEAREPQKLLAKEIISALHGEDKWRRAVYVSDLLFSQKYTEVSFTQLSAEEIQDIFKEAPWVKLPSASAQKSIISVLSETNLQPSNSAVRRLIDSKALRINSEPITDGNNSLSSISAFVI